MLLRSVWGKLSFAALVQAVNTIASIGFRESSSDLAELVHISIIALGIALGGRIFRSKGEPRRRPWTHMTGRPRLSGVLAIVFLSFSIPGVALCIISLFIRGALPADNTVQWSTAGLLTIGIMYTFSWVSLRGVSYASPTAEPSHIQQFEWIIGIVAVLATVGSSLIVFTIRLNPLGSVVSLGVTLVACIGLARQWRLNERQ